MKVPGKMAVAVAITKGDNNTSRIHSVSQESETPTTDEANHTPTGVLPLQLELDERANPLIWRKHGTAPPSYSITCLDGTFDVPVGRLMEDPKLAKALPTTQTFTTEEWENLNVRKPPHMSSHILAEDGYYYVPAEEAKFEQGGRPRTREDLHTLGFTLDKAIDPLGVKDAQGNYPPLPDEQKKVLYDIALKYWYVWARDARTPELSRLVILRIPTGDVTPIAQKPYPLPYKYLDAVRKEVQKLLDGGLIEPCISNWASPVLVRLKKDSTPEDIKLKLIIDFRRLNEVTVPDVAGLGDQDEILDGFGGDQKFGGIVDAAGGFYQYLIHPKDRSKTAFCLPTSMGGTSFQWRVAPYGLSTA